MKTIQMILIYRENGWPRVRCLGRVREDDAGVMKAVALAASILEDPSKTEVAILSRAEAIGFMRELEHVIIDGGVGGVGESLMLQTVDKQPDKVDTV